MEQIFTSDGGAQSIAKLPLDTFTQNGADTVVSLFSLWGLSQLLSGLFNGLFSDAIGFSFLFCIFY